MVIVHPPAIALQPAPQTPALDGRASTFNALTFHQYWGINVRSRGFLTSERRRHAPTIQNRRRETSTCHPRTTWGGRILTLHLNYVAGYTDPLRFLFERTQQPMRLTTRGKAWFPCLGRSKVHSASLVRAVNDGMISRYHSIVCVFLCFIKPILGNRYGPRVNSLRL